MLKPSLVSCALFQFMWTNNDFQGPLIYIADMDKYTNSVYLRMSMDGDVGFQWNRILAMSLISIIPSLVVFFCAQDSFIDGIAAGGNGYQPAKPPFSVMDTSGFPYFTQVTIMVVQAAAAAARLVVIMIWPTDSMVLSPVMETVEPPLNPNQPIHRMNMPGRPG